MSIMEGEKQKITHKTNTNIQKQKKKYPPKNMNLFF